MQISTTVDLKPFPVHEVVYLQLPFKSQKLNCVSAALGELTDQVLEDLCKQFRSDVFKIAEDQRKNLGPGDLKLDTTGVRR